MTTKCIYCQHFTLKAQPRAALGMYACPFRPRWETQNPFCARECKDFERVPEAVMEAGIKFEKGNT